MSWEIEFFERSTISLTSINAPKDKKVADVLVENVHPIHSKMRIRLSMDFNIELTDDDENINDD